jgi:hypothetical protein
MYLYRVCRTDCLGHYEWSNKLSSPLYPHLLNYIFQDVRSTRIEFRNSNPLSRQMVECNTTPF